MEKRIRYSAYVAASIDGRIAQNNLSGTDWTSKEDWNFFKKSLSKADAVIAGHNTYKVAEESLQKRNTIVLTSKLKHLKTIGTVTFFNPKKSSLNKFLQSKNYKNVGVVGGPKVYNFCLENKMLDDLFVTIEPYIFSKGVPMFSSDRFKKNRLYLHSIKRLNMGGTLLLHYKNGN